MSIDQDKEMLPPGSPFRDRIDQRIRTCDAMVFLVSGRTFEPGRYAWTELEAAIERWPHPRDRVLTVNIGEVDIATLDPYLRENDVLKPKGDVATEVCRAIRGMERRLPARRAGHRLKGRAGGASCTAPLFAFIDRERRLVTLLMALVTLLCAVQTAAAVALGGLSLVFVCLTIGSLASLGVLWLLFSQLSQFSALVLDLDQIGGPRAAQEGNESIGSWDFWLSYNTAVPLLGFSVAMSVIAIVLRAVSSTAAAGTVRAVGPRALLGFTIVVVGYLAAKWHANKRFPKDDKPMREWAREWMHALIGRRSN